MRIGIDCRMYSSRFTGIGRYVYELTQNLFQLDHYNDYVLFFNEPEYTEFREPNRRVTKMLANARHYSPQEQTTFLLQLNKAKLDLMHFTHFNRPIFYNRPSIVTIHDLTLSFFPGKKMNTPIYRYGYQKTVKTALSKAAKVIAVSEYTKSDIQKLFQTPTEKISVIYEGVNENFQPITHAPTLETVQKKYQITAPYLLYTGVWRSHKNLQNLIKAFHILKKDYQIEHQLVITGRKDQIYAPEIEGQTLSLKLDNDVIFTGLVDETDLVPLYAGASTYVFPSLYEGFGLPPLEAMACGVPVAASNTSSIPEVCGSGNALFFDPTNPYDMADKIFQLVSQASLRQKLIERGLKRVKQFSWDTMSKETFTLYKKILNQKI